MALPQTRPLTDTDGVRWLVTVDAGCLVLTRTDTGASVRFADPAELRSLAPQLTRAVTEHTLDQQLAAAKASADRRLRRHRAGAGGLAHGPFVEPPEPPLNLDPLIPRKEPA